MADGLAKKLTQQDRQRLIFEHHATTASATAAKLAVLTDASLMTVHRDIDAMARRGILRKFHGGVSMLPTTVFESSAEFRMQTRTAAKHALAKTAVTLIEPGMSIMLDDSSTVLALVPLLDEVGPLTVITNFRPAIEMLRDHDDLQLIVVGGRFSRTHDSFIASPSNSDVESYAVDIVFQSTSTMGPEMTYHQEQDIVQMKRSMLRSGEKRVLMMDSSKVGRTSLHRYVPVADFTDVVLTDDVDPDTVEAVRQVTRVHLAPPR